MIHKPAETPNTSSELGMLFRVQVALRLGFVNLGNLNLFKLMFELLHVEIQFLHPAFAKSLLLSLDPKSNSLCTAVMTRLKVSFPPPIMSSTCTPSTP